MTDIKRLNDLIWKLLNNPTKSFEYIPIKNKDIEIRITGIHHHVYKKGTSPIQFRIENKQNTFIKKTIYNFKISENNLEEVLYPISIKDFVDIFETKVEEEILIKL